MSDCGCLYSSFDDIDPAGFSVQKTLAARRPHRCCECHREIKPREHYVRGAGTNDGSFWSNATCLLCDEIRNRMLCNGFMYGELWEQITEQLFRENLFRFECLDGMSVEAREKVLSAWRKWKGLEVGHA